MKIAIGCDHAGYVLKDAVVNFLRSKANEGIEILDLGAYELNPEDDYTNPGFKVGGAILDEEADLGVLMCGTGFGISIAANKVPGVRAVPCCTAEQAKMAKAHNNANIIALGGNLIKPENVAEILETWLSTPFEGGRHLRRINKIAQAEKSTLNMINQGGGRVVIFNHPLVQHKVGIIRDVNTSVKQFRELLQEIAGLMVYEITRNLPLTDKEVQTPIEKTKVKTIEGKKLAIVPVLRAGLGMVDGILQVVPNAKVGHIGLYRDPKTLEPVEYYCKLPFDIEERDIFVLDPMLATGGSASAAISLIKKRGGRKISLVCLIAAPDGIERVHNDHPDASIFIAALDSHLNDHGYIVPGLGDAGDRLFGTK
ncbi:MAG: uracil phosphoribosyltransferase [Synergistaceae bacterium]|nr:uracil phosphoribosyltransferase [Synergistaceae bacterium]